MDIHRLSTGICVKVENPQNAVYGNTDRYKMEEEEMDSSNGVIHINVHHSGGSDEDKLNGIELYLKNEDAFKNIANVTATGIK